MTDAEWDELFDEARKFALKTIRTSTCRDVWNREIEDLEQIAAMSAWMAIRRAKRVEMDKAHVLRYAGVAARGMAFQLFFRNKNELDRNGSNKKTDFFRFDDDALYSAVAPEPIKHEPIDERFLKFCTPMERKVLKLYFESELLDYEIAGQMGVSRQAVNDTRRRGMRRVRWVLQA